MARGISGKTALVTGGASGIGKTTALAFAKEGAKVVVATDKNIAGAEETIRLIREAGGEAVFIKCNVSIEHEVEGLVSGTVEASRQVDMESIQSSQSNSTTAFK